MIKYLYLAIMAPLVLVINEYTIHWLLAVVVGGYGVADGFADAFASFSIFGYLFFTAFRLVPYFGLGIVLFIISKTRFKDYSLSVFIGGLTGIVAMIAWGSWVTLLPLYTNQHVSSTTALAFLVIPIFAVCTGAIGAGIMVAIAFLLRRKQRVEDSTGELKPPAIS